LVVVAAHSYEYVKSCVEGKNCKLNSKEYLGNKHLLDLICPEGHPWQVGFQSFMKGCRYGECEPGGGYSTKLSGTIYYLRFDTAQGPLWKVGITNQSVRSRFSSEKIPYTVIWQQTCEDGSIPPTLEKNILRKFKRFQYKGKILKSGNTECFIHDVLGYDRPTAQLDLFAKAC
jgi:hypothetical protein